VAEPATPAERPALLRRLGVAEWAAGEPAAIGHLEEALNEARDATAIGAASGPLANAYLVSDQADIAVAVLQRAIARIRPTDPRLALRLDGAAALFGLMDDRTAPAALRMVDRLQASLGEAADPPARVLVAIAHAEMRRAQAADEAERLLERALAREAYPPRPRASAAIIVTLMGLEAFGTLQRLCDDMLSAARRRSAVQDLIGIASFSAWALYRCGELADAEAQARWALEHASGIWAIDALAHLVETLVERDALDDAAAELQQMAPPVTSHSVLVGNYLMARGQLRMAQGRREEALQDFLACGERCAPLGMVDGLYEWRSAAAIAHALLGRAAEARRLARSAVKVMRGFGRPGLWVSRCAPRAWPRAATAVSACSARRSRCSSARRRRSSWPARSPTTVRRSAGRATAARRGLSWSADLTWRTTVARAASLARPGRSSSRRAPNRGATRSPAATP